MNIFLQSTLERQINKFVFWLVQLSNSKTNLKKKKNNKV